LLLYSSKPSLGVFQLAGYFTSSTNANKLSGTIITAPALGGLPHNPTLDKQAGFAWPTCITSWQKLTSKTDL
jgi:hypothetical protein